MRTNLLYVHSAALGYGRMGMKLAAALARAGVDICDDMPDAYGGQQKFIPHVSGQSGKCGHVGWLSTPGHMRGWWDGQVKSLLSMWEATILPEPFRESLDEFDIMMVPSQQNLELFGKYHKNVHLVPLGIDPTEWHPTERPTLDDPHFTFFISGGGHRKGSDLVIEAFRKVFDGRIPDGPAPRLFVHSAKASEFPRDERIHLFTGKLTDEEEVALYGMCHVYVQPSRGEGFGLRPLQAMAQGCPTIATNAHGHAAYGHLITYPLGWAYNETPPEAFHHGPAGFWWEPNFDELCEMMEDVYLNYDSAVVKAQENAKLVATEFSWDNTATKWIDAVGRDVLELPDIQSNRWVEPTARRYMVITNQDKFFEVGGVQYLLEKGVEYYEPADVKRVLFDGGFLDPACLSHLQRAMSVLPGEPAWGEHDDELTELDSGLTPEQYSQIENYTGSQALCPNCHQFLNSAVPTVEQMEALPMPRET